MKNRWIPNINKILFGQPVYSARGAPMGARDEIHDLSRPLLLQRIVFVDGDYAPDGTYWGGGSGVKALWCAFNDDTDEYQAGMGTRIYVRADTFEQASEEVKRAAPGAQIEMKELCEPSEPFEMDDDDEAFEESDVNS